MVNVEQFLFRQKCVVHFNILMPNFTILINCLCVHNWSWIRELRKMGWKKCCDHIFEGIKGCNENEIVRKFLLRTEVMKWRTKVVKYDNLVIKLHWTWSFSLGMKLKFIILLSLQKKINFRKNNLKERPIIIFLKVEKIIIQRGLAILCTSYFFLFFFRFKFTVKCIFYLEIL